MKLFLAGDVMTGRGIDQILAAPCDPGLDEPWIKDARDYVRLAEEASGPIPRRVEPGYVWGDALAELEAAQPDARIVNLETAITTCPARAPKGIHYRMSPANAPCLTAAKLDCCVLANNHVLDWGPEGLEETLDALRALGIGSAGAGDNAGEARAPARIGTPLLVFAFAMESAGVPSDWAAGLAHPGVSFLPDLSTQTTEALADFILATKRAHERVVVSMHWGSNWGYQVAHNQRTFARRLIDGGAADLVYGHSSHHPRRLEIYRDRLILYGCGDLINDYEGISGHQAFRPELSFLYFPVLEPETGRLAELTLAPMRMHRFQLQRASREETEWLAALVRRESGLHVERLADGRLRVR